MKGFAPAPCFEIEAKGTSEMALVLKPEPAIFGSDVAK